MTGPKVRGVESGWGWRDRAACRGVDPGVFFPADGGSVDRAKRVCAGCPVRPECLEFAVVGGESFGVWGGRSSVELAVWRKEVVS